MGVATVVGRSVSRSGGWESRGSVGDSIYDSSRDRACSQDSQAESGVAAVFEIVFDGGRRIRRQTGRRFFFRLALPRARGRCALVRDEDGFSMMSDGG
jgi:hypothetical protein